jgi:uncharacterized FlgJ-related protein
MKQLHLLFILFILAACSVKKSSSIKPQDGGTIEQFASNFEKATLIHDANQIMLFMENGYVKEQHDQFLEGRTEQFLNEFYCGNNVSSNAFECAKYQKIYAVENVSVVKKENWYDYTFKVKVGTQWILVKQTITEKPSGYSNKYGLVGASG